MARGPNIRIQRRIDISEKMWPDLYRELSDTDDPGVQAQRILQLADLGARVVQQATPKTLASSAAHRAPPATPSPAPEAPARTEVKSTVQTPAPEPDLDDANLALNFGRRGQGSIGRIVR